MLWYTPRSTTDKNGETWLEGWDGVPGGRQDGPRFSPRGLPDFSIDVDNKDMVEIWGAHIPEMRKCAGD